MIREHRDVLDEIATKMRAGRISRRAFLERAITIGLTSSAATSLIAACGGGSNPVIAPNTTTILTWESEHDSLGTYDQLVDKYNKSNSDNIHVIYVNGPIDTGQARTEFLNMLKSRSGQVDIMSMDVIWPAEFAANHWTLPIGDKWPQSEREKYLPGPIESCTFNGQIWAVPHRIDVGLIYYRKDLIASPPNTWDELTDIAKSAQQRIQYGYVWQGAKYEGLVCDFVEVLYGYGGAILAADDPKKVVVSSPEALQALTRMVSWVGNISPIDVTTYEEEDARVLWQNGRAAFMRNWPYAYVPSNDTSMSQIAGKFDVHSMPYGGNNSVGHSCIGGYNLGINAYSKHPDAAWKFIQYLLSPDAQKYIALNESLIGTLTSIHDDPDVIAKNPFFRNLKSTLQNAKPRPVSPKYPDISNSIQLRIYQALKRQLSPSEALRMLQTDLEGIVSRST